MRTKLRLLSLICLGVQICSGFASAPDAVASDAKEVSAAPQAQSKHDIVILPKPSSELAIQNWLAFSQDQQFPNQACQLTQSSLCIDSSRNTEMQQKVEVAFAQAVDQILADRSLKRSIIESAKAFEVDSAALVSVLAIARLHATNRKPRFTTLAANLLLNQPDRIPIAGAGLFAGKLYSYRKVSLSDFQTHPLVVKDCGSKDTQFGVQSSLYWNCLEAEWNSGFRGRIRDGLDYSEARTFRGNFFPTNNGFLGMTALRALKVSAAVKQKTGIETDLKYGLEQLDQQVATPNFAIAYFAAEVAETIEIYRTIAGLEISPDLGLLVRSAYFGDARKKATIWKQRLSYGIEKYNQDIISTLINAQEGDIRRKLTEKL